MKVVSKRVANGENACSSGTGAYCKARERLSENLINQTMKEVGRQAHEKSGNKWKWKGKNVILGDGTTVSMPDTKENQAVYPQPTNQKEGVGFPIARLVGLISLSSGTVLDYAVGIAKGKGTGEHSLLKGLLRSFSPGDIFLADSYYCTYFLISMLLSIGVNVVSRQHSSRKTDFSKGESLGNNDHIVTWSKPLRCPDWIDSETYERAPKQLIVRELKVNGKIIVTTFINAKEISKKEIGELYDSRWMIEIDFKFIKEVLQMDILRCKSPEMVRKEIGVHLLAFNLLRTVMAQAASLYDILPRTISFKATLQAVNSFTDKMLLLPDKAVELYQALQQAIVSHRIGNRPGRLEPRAVKRRPKPFPRLKKPRYLAREELNTYP